MYNYYNYGNLTNQEGSKSLNNGNNGNVNGLNSTGINGNGINNSSSSNIGNNNVSNYRDYQNQQIQNHQHQLQPQQQPHLQHQLNQQHQIQLPQQLVGGNNSTVNVNNDNKNLNHYYNQNPQLVQQYYQQHQQYQYPYSVPNNGYENYVQMVPHQVYQQMIQTNQYSPPVVSQYQNQTLQLLHQLQQLQQIQQHSGPPVQAQVHGSQPHQNSPNNYTQSQLSQSPFHPISTRVNHVQNHQLQQQQQPQVALQQSPSQPQPQPQSQPPPSYQFQQVQQVIPDNSKIPPHLQAIYQSTHINKLQQQQQSQSTPLIENRIPPISSRGPHQQVQQTQPQQQVQTYHQEVTEPQYKRQSYGPIKNYYSHSNDSVATTTNNNNSTNKNINNNIKNNSSNHSNDSNNTPEQNNQYYQPDEFHNQNYNQQQQAHPQQKSNQIPGQHYQYLHPPSANGSNGLTFDNSFDINTNANTNSQGDKITKSTVNDNRQSKKRNRLSKSKTLLESENEPSILNEDDSSNNRTDSRKKRRGSKKDDNINVGILTNEAPFLPEAEPTPIVKDKRKRGRPKVLLYDSSTNEYMDSSHPNYKSLRKELAGAGKFSEELLSTYLAKKELVGSSIISHNYDQKEVQNLMQKKDKRGRPRKFPIEQTGITVKGVRVIGMKPPKETKSTNNINSDTVIRKGRGRPRKQPIEKPEDEVENEVDEDTF